MLDKLRAPSTDSDNPNVSRRAFLGRFAALGAVGFLAACGGDEAVPAAGEAVPAGGEYPVVNAETCAGYDALDEQALQARSGLNYQDNSPEAGQYCGNCRFKQEWAEDSRCLGCTLFAGPVSPGGWCLSWAAAA